MIVVTLRHVWFGAAAAGPALPVVPLHGESCVRHVIVTALRHVVVAVTTAAAAASHALFVVMMCHFS